jgi:hypothetical protein
MAKPRWDRQLPWPLHTRDGETFKTLADARDYALNVSSEYSWRNHWQHAAKLLVEAAGRQPVRGINANEAGIVFRHAARRDEDSCLAALTPNEAKVIFRPNISIRVRLGRV